MLNLFQVSVFFNLISCDCYCFWSIIGFNVQSLLHFNFLAVPLPHIHSVCWSSPFYIHSLPLLPSFAILKHLTCVLAAPPPRACISWCHLTAFLPVFITFSLLLLAFWTGHCALNPVCFQADCLAFDHMCIWPVSLPQSNKPLNVICCVSCWPRPHFHRQCNRTSGY